MCTAKFLAYLEMHDVTYYKHRPFPNAELPSELCVGTVCGEDGLPSACGGRREAGAALQGKRAQLRRGRDLGGKFTAKAPAIVGLSAEVSERQTAIQCLRLACRRFFL